MDFNNPRQRQESNLHEQLAHLISSQAPLPIGDNVVIMMNGHAPFDSSVVS